MELVNCIDRRIKLFGIPNSRAISQFTLLLSCRLSTTFPKAPTRNNKGYLCCFIGTAIVIKSPSPDGLIQSTLLIFNKPWKNHDWIIGCIIINHP